MNKKTILALAVGTALYGCSDNGSNANPKQSPAANAGECRDVNFNGACDVGETFTGTATVPTLKRASSNASGRSAYFFAAPGTNPSDVNAWSTLVYNEILMNPYMNGDRSAAEEHIKKTLNLSANALSDDQQKAFLSSLTKALADNPDSNFYAVAAAVASNVMTSKSFDVSVTADDVALQKPLTFKYASEPQAETVATWNITDHDQRTRQIQAYSDDIVVIDQWHNAVVRVTPTSSTQAVQGISFSAFNTSGHHVQSTDADYVSGASEHVLREGYYTKNTEGKDTFVALVDAPKGEAKDGDDTFGLFSVPVNNGGLATQNTPSVDGKKAYALAHKAGKRLVLDDAKIEHILPVADGVIWALIKDSDDKFSVQAYNHALKAQGKPTALKRSVLDWKAADSGRVVYVLLKGKEKGDVPTLVKYKAADASEIKRKDVAASDRYLAASKQADVVAVTGGKQLTLFGNDLEKIDAMALSGNGSSRFALSDDASHIALAVSGTSYISVVERNRPLLSVSAKLAYDGRLRALTFDANDRLYFADEQGKLKSVNLSGTKQQATQQEIVNGIAESMTAERINNGYRADAVIWNLNLPTRSADVPGLSIGWSSNNAVVSTANDTLGHINQPAIGSDNVGVKLSMTATVNFRGQSEQASKDFDLTVRAASEKKPITLLNLPKKINKNRYEWASANDSGTRFVIYDTPNTGDNKNGGFAIFERDGEPSADKSGLKLTSAQDALVDFGEALKTYRAYRLAWQGDDKLLAVIGDTKGDNTGNGKILRWDFSKPTDQQAWEEIKSFAVPVVGAQTDGKRNIVSIMFKKDDAYTMGAWKISDLSEVVAAVTTEQTSRYYSINASGDVSYISEGGKLSRYVLNAAKDAYERVDQYGTFKRMYYTIVDGDTFYGIDAGDTTNGVLSIVPGGKGKIDAATVTEFSTARGSYTDNKRHGFYVSTLEKSGDTLISAHKGSGVVALDVSDTANIKEVFTTDLSNVYRIDASANGDYLFVYNRAEKRGKGVDSVGLIKLK